MGFVETAIFQDSSALNSQARTLFHQQNGWFVPDYEIRAWLDGRGLKFVGSC